MDGNPIALLRLLVPQIPGISYAALQHTLGVTHTSSKWDLRTAVTVHILRNIMSSRGRTNPPPISKVQGRTLTDPGVKGRMWIANATLPKTPAEDEADGQGVRSWVCKAVDELAEGEVRYTRPEVESVEVEWTGFRPGAGQGEGLPSGIDEAEKYRRMMAEPCRTSETTILYFHGGAYYLCDPRTHRSLTARLAQECKGRVCSVRYRLAPQTAFPGQLIDALLVYLSLIYPPEGALHAAVPAEQIVFGGDSAGGHVSLCLLQLLLQMHRSTSGAVPVVRFHGRDVHVPLPAGVTANSGWFDISRSMPSITTNAKWDYLPAADHNDAVSIFPKDHIWPADPPRGDLFCDLSLLDHPLVALHLADWTNAPPLWLNTGEEMLSDEDILLATRAAKAGVKVHFEQYEAMPHCFALLIPTLVQSERLLRSWGDWCRRAVEEREGLRTEGVWVPARGGGEERVLDVESLETVGLEEARRLVKEAKELRMRGFDDGKAMPKPAL